MSLVLVSPEHDVFLPSQHNGTFRGNNLAFVAATQALNFWKNEQVMHKRTSHSSHIIAEELLQLASMMDGSGYSLRGKGMIYGLECPNREIANSISNKCFKNGLIVETCGSEGEVVKLLPPITIERQVLEDGLSILGECVLSL